MESPKGCEKYQPQCLRSIGWPIDSSHRSSVPCNEYDWCIYEHI